MFANFSSSVAILIFYFLIATAGVQNTQPNEENLESTGSKTNLSEIIGSTGKTEEEKRCSAPVLCSNMPVSCLNCNFNYSCVYGLKQNLTCSPANNYPCEGDREFKKTMICRYCYQTDSWEHFCTHRANCNTVAAPKSYYRTNCSVKEDVICLGKRQFLKNLPCNWSGGYKWSTALLLSTTLGGFGADRFYLGHWQEGIGKLFSFGGLGVWTLIDVILIALQYLGPADGSLYV